MLVSQKRLDVDILDSVSFVSLLGEEKKTDNKAMYANGADVTTMLPGICVLRIESRNGISFL